MTDSITSMLFPSHGQLARPAGEALNVPTPTDADAEARRVAIAVGRGDEAAFRELYDRYHERLLRLAIVLARGNESLAGETVQSVFVITASKLRRVESAAHLWNWLARIARQQLARTRRSQPDATIVAVADLPECANVRELDSALEDNLEVALRTLTAEDRQLIEWFYFDGLSHKEIAGRLGATPKAVSSRLERPRAQLRSMLTQTLAHEN
jgi:RNA polymerase sigma-70 factor (ECF subfamily)